MAQTRSSSQSGPPPVPRRHPSRPTLHPTPPSAPLELAPSIDGQTTDASSVQRPERPERRRSGNEIPSDDAPHSPYFQRPISAIYLGEGSESPGLALGIKIATGFAGKVGLGSPKLDFRPNTASSTPVISRRDTGSSPSVLALTESVTQSPEASPEKESSKPDAVSKDEGEAEDEHDWMKEQDLSIDSSYSADKSSRRTSWRTPSAFHDGYLMNESPPPSVRPDLSRLGTATSSHSVPRDRELQRSESQSSHSSARQRLRPKTMSGMSRSISTSSSLYASSSNQEPSPYTSPQKHMKSFAPEHSQSPSNASASSHQSRRESKRLSAFVSHRVAETEDDEDLDRRDRASVHSRSPSLASASSSRQSRRSSKRMSGHWHEEIDRSSYRHQAQNTREAKEDIDQGRRGGASSSRQVSDGAELDERIRQAEEKIRLSNNRLSSRSPTNNKDISLHEPSIRRNDSYKHSPRKSTEQQARPPSTGYDQSTLRRSATLSSATSRSQATEIIDTPSRVGMTGLRTVDLRDEDEKERSGGSAGIGKRRPLPADFRQNGLFTPSPKPPSDLHEFSSTGSHRISRVRQLAESPEERYSDLPSTQNASPVGRFNTVNSPSSPFPRSSTSHDLHPSPANRLALRNREASNYSQRQWSESISGLPSASQLDHRGPPPPRGLERDIERFTPDRARPDSVLGTNYDRNRYNSRTSSLTHSSSRLALTPGDSVSAVGARNGTPVSSGVGVPDSAKKDPLEVLRRIEQSRENANKLWEEDRAQSVLGDLDRSPRRVQRPASREGSGRTHLPPRSATSMSSLRDAAYASGSPLSAPLNRSFRRAFDDQASAVDSPSASLRRGPSRLSQPPLSRIDARPPASGPEPRSMRSSTSLGGRSGTSLDAHAASTEHGRLLLEALRALELKLPPNSLNAAPDLVRSLQAAVTSQETINTCSRNALGLATKLDIALQLGQASKNDIEHILPLVRETTKASDQSIRDLTRVLLDLPKLLREASRFANPTPARSAFDPPSRHSLYEPTSPLAGMRGSDEGTPGTGTRRKSSLAGFVDKLRPSSVWRDSPHLPPINQSPPDKSSMAPRSRIHEYDQDKNTPLPASPPSKTLSPERERFRNPLKKKASTTSNQTIRGSASSFFPYSAKTATTAISQVTAGDVSPSNRSIKSYRSGLSIGGMNGTRSARNSLDAIEPISPVSRYSLAHDSHYNVDHGENDMN